MTVAEVGQIVLEIVVIEVAVAVASNPKVKQNK